MSDADFAWEVRQLEQWRLDQLIGLGMPPELARTLLSRADVAHEAERLVAAGCDVFTAWEILADD